MEDVAGRSIYNVGTQDSRIVTYSLNIGASPYVTSDTAFRQASGIIDPTFSLPPNLNKETRDRQIDNEELGHAAFNTRLKQVKTSDSEDELTEYRKRFDSLSMVEKRNMHEGVAISFSYIKTYAETGDLRTIEFLGNSFGIWQLAAPAQHDLDYDVYPEVKKTIEFLKQDGALERIRSMSPEDMLTMAENISLEAHNERPNRGAEQEALRQLRNSDDALPNLIVNFPEGEGISRQHLYPGHFFQDLAEYIGSREFPEAAKRYQTDFLEAYDALIAMGAGPKSEVGYEEAMDRYRSEVLDALQELADPETGAVHVKDALRLYSEELVILDGVSEVYLSKIQRHNQNINNYEAVYDRLSQEYWGPRNNHLGVVEQRSHVQREVAALQDELHRYHAGRIMDLENEADNAQTTSPATKPK